MKASRPNFVFLINSGTCSRIRINSAAPRKRRRALHRQDCATRHSLQTPAWLASDRSQIRTALLATAAARAHLDTESV